MNPVETQSQIEFDAYWRGASQAAEHFGYRLDEIRWAPDCSPHRFEQNLRTRNVQGVLIPPHLSPPDWGNFDGNKFSVIRFGLSVTQSRRRQNAARKR
jgi:hypothetical protein